jgi:hypothetical protein
VEPRTERVLLALAAAVVPAVAFAPFMPIDVDVHHDGLMLKTALDVHSGQVLFRDTFTQYGALTTYVHVVALWLLGPHLLALKEATLVAYALAAVALTAVWARLLPLSLVVASLLVWVLMASFYSSVWTFQPWASVIALACQAASIYAFVRAWESPAPWPWAALSGALASLTFHARTPVGICHTVAMAVVWVYAAVARRDRRFLSVGLGAYLLGAVAIHALYFATLVRSGTVSAWYDAILENPSQYSWPRGVGIVGVVQIMFPGTRSLTRLNAFAYWKESLSFPLAVTAFLASFLALPALRGRVGWTRARLAVLAAIVAAVVALVLAVDPFLLGTVHGLALAIPLSALGVLGWAVLGLVGSRQDDDPSRRLAGAVALPALASWSQYFPTTDPQHVFWASSPAVGLLVFAMFRLAGRRRVPVVVMLCLLLAPLTAVKILEGRAKYGQPYVTIKGVPVLAGMRVLPHLEQEYQRVYAAIRDYEGRGRHVPIAIVGSNSLIATFALNLDNPQPYFVRLGSAAQMRLEPESLSRFIAYQRPLVLVDPPSRFAVKVVAKRFGYVELFATPYRVILAPE